ncbi:hypothetical protein [Kitasatospora sp. NPDC002040]|uniref:hypothetical protein n=1 Tax=Kitasatospora sp. NPDC002040 TaxID=3154661 RepID=UPI003325FB72
MRRRAVLPAAALTALALCAGPAAAEEAPVEDTAAAAQAFDGDTPLADAPALARGCGQEYGCSFRVLPGLSREFTTAVVSLGNAAVNCTNRPITVERTVALESSTTDNIAGEISGSATLEGTIDNTTDVSGSAGISNTTTGTHTDITAPSDKGPNADIANGGSVTVAGSVTGAAQLKLSAKATFALAYRASFSHEWKRTSTETTTVRFTVRQGDELQFGVLNAMTRTVGVLGVDGTGKLIKNVVVDSPSTVNVSSVVAQTFSATDRCLSLRPPGRSLPDGLLEVAPGAAPAGPVERYRLAPEGSWARQ